MRDFDYAGWVHRARAFVAAAEGREGFEADADEPAPPIGAADADWLVQHLGRPLPAALRGLLERGAAGLDCHYTFEYDPDDASQTAEFLALFPYQMNIYGGARFGPADALPEFIASCAEWAGVVGGDEDDENEEEAARGASDLWARSLPFLAIENGDYVALDLKAADPEDPPVVYLSHDGESGPLATSFTAFLAAWERLCYVGPEVWLLDTFRGPDGLLAPEGEAAARLRRLLGV